jgi:hypothetical protein
MTQRKLIEKYSKMKKLIIGSLIAVTALATTTFAQSGFQAKPGTYDPDNTNIVTAAWLNKLGLPDKGGSSFGLLLAKDGATTANAAAGASITGVSGIMLTQLGFDYKNGGHCTGGSPRFNVEASDGFHFMGGCANSTSGPSPVDPAWTRVRINPFNPAQAFPPLTPGATIVSITLLADEGTDNGTGNTLVDNILINTTMIDKPGSAK